MKTNWRGIASTRVVNVGLTLKTLTRPFGALGQPVLMPEVTADTARVLRNARIELNAALEAVENALADR